jgi:hypothetical protein
MCEHCDDEVDLDETFEEFFARAIHPVIDRCGWYIQYVHDDRGGPAYAYTVGLTEHGCPELIATGLTTPEEAMHLLNAGGELVHRRYLLHGDRVTVAGRRVEVVALPHPEAHLLFAGDAYGPDLTAVQLVYADDSGIWPWSRGHRGGVGGQPVLGPRALRRRAG